MGLPNFHPDRGEAHEAQTFLRDQWPLMAATGGVVMISNGTGGKEEGFRGKEGGYQGVRGKYNNSAFHIHMKMSRYLRNERKYSN